LNIPWLEIFGYTLAGQRLSSLVWTLLTVGIGVVWLRRNVSWTAATFYLALLLGSPVWLAFSVKGKTYAFASLAILAGTIAIQAHWKLWLRWVVFVAAAGLAVGARLPAAAFFFPAGICLLFLTPGWRFRIAAIVFTVALAGIEVCLFSAGHWDNILFWTLEFHRESTFRFSILDRVVPLLRYAPAVWIFLVISLEMDLKAKAGRRVMALGSLIAAVLLNLSSAATYAEYILPFIPAIVFVIAPRVANFLHEQSRPAFISGVAVVLMAGWNLPPRQTHDVLIRVAEAEDFLRAHVPPGSLVAGSMPEIPVATGHPVPLSMSMGKFAITEDIAPNEASARLMLTPVMLREVLSDPETKAIVFYAGGLTWNFFWSLPSYRLLSDTAKAEIQQTIDLNYEKAFVNETYSIFLRKESD
jgi:hypothetical protein